MQNNQKSIALSKTGYVAELGALRISLSEIEREWFEKALSHAELPRDYVGQEIRSCVNVERGQRLKTKLANCRFSLDEHIFIFDIVGGFATLVDITPKSAPERQEVKA